MTNKVIEIALKSNTSWAEWVTISIAFVALSVTIYFSIKNYKLTKLVTLINVIAHELSTDESREDRRIIGELVDPSLDEIRNFVVSSRDINNKNKEAKYGRAIARTIARLDRISFFLLGNGEKPHLKPPVWLWTHISDAWEKLGDWVEHRQKCKEDIVFYHVGYGYYFMKLANFRKNNIDKINKEYLHVKS